MLDCTGLRGSDKRKNITFREFHELIKLPDIPFPFYSLRCILQKSDVISAEWALALSILVNQRMRWIELLTISGQSDVMEVNGLANGSLEFDT